MARALLRFIACGSVDDGKSTLIGRLLHDTGSVPEDQLEEARAQSRRAGFPEGEIDLSLLTDGLAAEREQGITIDVAYRFFSTPARSFIVADAPGHEQYTRNMVTGASTADLALIVVDARKGVLPQTRRHAYVASLLGIRHFVLAVTKMDMVDDGRAAFDAIVADYSRIAADLGLPDATAIPLSGRRGDNVARPSEHMPWYEGPTLIGHLEQVEPEAEAGSAMPFAMPVQWVNRASPGFRGLAGTIARGAVRPGDRVRLLPSGSETAIARIITLDGDLDAAGQGQAVTLTLADEVECGRGEVICAAGAPLEVADQFEATLVWMDAEAMLPGRSYWLKLGCATVSATVTALKHEVGLATLEHMAARSLALNAIGVVNLALDRPLPFAPYAESRDLGGFLLIDRATERTLGAGMIRFALRRSQNIRWQAQEVTPEAHAAQKGQRPCLLWFTGLSGAGKSTIANLVERRLYSLGRHSFLLDGDNLRHGLNRDLGFTDADRAENIRRAGEVAKLMTEAGLIVLAAFISPFRAERDAVRRLMPEGDFIEVHVDAPLEEAERRDPKGLYRRARAGQIRNFTGLDSPYEPPLHPEIRIDTTTTSAEEAAERIVAFCLGTGRPGEG